MRWLRAAVVSVGILSALSESKPAIGAESGTTAGAQSIVAWVSPYDTISNVIEITATNGMIVNAPANVPMYRRTKSGTIWREVRAPVTLTPGQHLRVPVPKLKPPSTKAVARDSAP